MDAHITSLPTTLAAAPLAATHQKRAPVGVRAHPSQEALVVTEAVTVHPAATTTATTTPVTAPVTIACAITLSFAPACAAVVFRCCKGSGTCTRQLNRGKLGGSCAGIWDSYRWQRCCTHNMTHNTTHTSTTAAMDATGREAQQFRTLSGQRAAVRNARSSHGPATAAHTACAVAHHCRHRHHHPRRHPRRHPVRSRARAEAGKGRQRHARCT